MATQERDIGAFLAACSALDDGELLALSAGRFDEEVAAREGALAIARSTARRLGLLADLGRMQDALLRWAEADGAYSGVYAPVSPVHDLFLADLRHQALPALADTGIAFVLGDALDAGSRRVLLAPWERVTGADRIEAGGRRSRRQAEDALRDAEQ